ncbi:MAG TPA: carboxymuconolactone decarboxylase family protein [Flavobacteriaceae bacterium]|nr:carboxymuconolactone decarboxylase family protein [Flavobacteriaceae bacterium]
MKERLNIGNLEPQAYKVLFEMEKYLNSCGLEKTQRELIKIRASQINHCAYCIDMHTAEALKNGETQRRIFALSAWTESPLFDEKERTLLAMTEEITLIPNAGLTEETYQRATEYFSENEIAQIILQIGQINFWNRIAVSSHSFFEK